MVPWWLPHVYGALWVAAAFWHVLRGHSARLALLPSRKSGWAGLALAVVLLGIGVWYGGAALKGRAPPLVPVIDITNPFGPGRYLMRFKFRYLRSRQ